MTIYSKARILETYSRCRDENLDREQALLATAQVHGQDLSSVTQVVAEKEHEDEVAHA